MATYTGYLVTSNVNFGYSDERCIAVCSGCKKDEILFCRSMDEFRAIQWCNKCLKKRATEISIPVGSTELVAVFVARKFGVEADGTIKIFKDFVSADNYAEQMTAQDKVGRCSESIVIRENSQSCKYYNDLVEDEVDEWETGDDEIDILENWRRKFQNDGNLKAKKLYERELANLRLDGYVPINQAAKDLYNSMVLDSMVLDSNINSSRHVCVDDDSD